MVHSINKGLTLPLAGAPTQDILAGPPITQVALLGEDYIGMRPTMLGRDWRSG